MKRFTLVLVVILVMCSIMFFPASAATDIDMVGLVEKLDYIQNEVVKILPSSFKYRIVIYYQASFDTLQPLNLYVSYCDTPIVTSGTKMYPFFVGNGGYTSIPALYTVSGVLHNTYNNRSVIQVNGSVSNQPSVTVIGRYYGVIDNLSTAKFYNIDSIQETALSKGFDLIYNQVSSVDTSALVALLAQAKSKQNTGYTATSWQALQNQIIAAESLLASTGFTQTQVDSAKNALQSAIDNLTLQPQLPNISELEVLLVEADTIEDIGYTAQTWTRFTNARYSGHVLVSSAAYTQSEVTNTTNELRYSMTGLTLVPVTPPPNPPSSPLGYDLESGNISGYLNPVPKIFYNYTVPVVPIAIGLFAIIFSIRLIPHILDKIISILRR